MSRLSSAAKALCGMAAIRLAAIKAQPLRRARFGECVRLDNAVARQCLDFIRIEPEQLTINQPVVLPKRGGAAPNLAWCCGKRGRHAGAADLARLFVLPFDMDAAGAVVR